MSAAGRQPYPSNRPESPAWDDRLREPEGKAGEGVLSDALRASRRREIEPQPVAAGADYYLIEVDELPPRWIRATNRAEAERLYRLFFGVGGSESGNGFPW